MIAAIFDIDGTLLPGASTDRLFFEYLLKKGVLGPVALSRTLAFMVKNIRGGSDQMIKKNKAYLKNVDTEVLLKHVKPFFERCIKPRIPESSRKIIKEHQFQGHVVILLSAALQPLVDLWKVEFEADEGIGTTIQVANGKYTGSIEGEHPFGEGKARWLETLRKQYSLELNQCYGYGDHFSDHFFLDAVGNPVVVDPTAKMRAYALNKAWLITDRL
ncbi:MAG: HAD-IB family hydrolase [bacterium]